MAQFHHRSDPKNLKQHETNNPFITGETAISAHRSGAGQYPEETLAAFRGCTENPDVQVDYFEFDLHMTADDVLVLSHDATLDRVSDAAAVFGAENVLVRDKTLAELKELNIAAQFVSGAGEAPYADLCGDAVPDAELSYGINLGTTTVINFAHAHNLAIQYWTVNSEEDMAYLSSVGADALITDYPDKAARVLSGNGENR